jgi:sulfoquinovose isomerase
VIDLAAETDRLLDFGRAARVPGGFAWLDDAGRPDPSEPLQLLITARMTHCYAVGHLLGRPDCAELVDHGLEALYSTFTDAGHGGWLSAVRAGRPVTTDKAAYDHAFVLLAGASATAAERPGGEELLAHAGEVMLERFWAEDEGANRERWDRAWRTPEGYRGANANMHAVEAFLAAGDATGDPAWHERALRIAERLIDATARAHAWRVVEHFDAGWRPLLDYNADRPRDQFRPFGVTPGHGLEWSRLLVQLHASLPEPPGWLLEAARGLFARAVDDGVAPDGGIVYTTDHDGRPVVRDRFHWVVAEAIGAAAALARATGEDAYEDRHRRFWAFAEAHLIDRERGGWRHELDPENRPAARTWHGKPDVYHALQATLVARLPLAPALAWALRDHEPEALTR